MTFDEARAQFPVLERSAYLNAGSVGPLMRATVETAGRWQQRELVDAAPQQVALTGSTTDGCNIVLAGLGLRREDEVVTTTDEHFGLLGPLHASGARIVVTPPDPDAIAAAVTPRTRLLAFSRVLWTTGALLPARGDP